MLSRLRNGRLLSLLLLVAISVALLTGCSLSSSACDEGDALVAAAQPARALQVYARAKAQGDGCAEKGLEVASTNQRRAVEEAARGEAMERAGDRSAAIAAYQAALALDVTNALAVTGLARLEQRTPVPLSPVVAQPSWWAGPWPYFLGSVLVAALLAAVVLWFELRMASGLRSRLDRFESRLEAASSDRLDDLRANRALIDALKRDAAARSQATDRALRELSAACANLDKEVRLQKERIDRLTELIDLFGQTQAEPTNEVVVRLKPRSVAEEASEGASGDEGGNGVQGGASTDGAVNAGDIRVEVNVFAIRIGHGQAVQEQLVVQRVIEHAMERDDAGRVDPSAQQDREALNTESEPGPVEKAAADSIVNLTWKRVEESWWVTPGYRGLADCAKWIGGVQNGWHALVLGRPAKYIALGLGFSPPSVDMMEAIAAKVGFLRVLNG